MDVNPGTAQPFRPRPTEPSARIKIKDADLVGRHDSHDMGEPTEGIPLWLEWQPCWRNNPQRLTILVYLCLLKCIVRIKMAHLAILALLAKSLEHRVESHCDEKEASAYWPTQDPWPLVRQSSTNCSVALCNFISGGKGLFYPMRYPPVIKHGWLENGP